jgi:hypothetical protein
LRGKSFKVELKTNNSKKVILKIILKFDRRLSPFALTERYQPAYRNILAIVLVISDLKLAYIHTCSSLSAEVMNSLSMEECDRFHVHRLCRDNRTAFIVVRRGKTNPEELVNIRTGDKGTVKRLIQMLNG